MLASNAALSHTLRDRSYPVLELIWSCKTFLQAARRLNEECSRGSTWIPLWWTEIQDGTLSLLVTRKTQDLDGEYELPDFWRVKSGPLRAGDQNRECVLILRSGERDIKRNKRNAASNSSRFWVGLRPA